jgi:hypothetical protein
MDKELQYHTIVKYLQHALPESEAQALRNQIASNPELALEVKIVQLELETGGALFDQEMEAQMAAWDAEDMAPDFAGKQDLDAAKKNSVFERLKRLNRRLISTILAVFMLGIAVIGIGIWLAGDRTPKPQNEIQENKTNETPNNQSAPKENPDKSAPVPTNKLFADNLSSNRSTIQNYLGSPLSDIRNTKSETQEDPLTPGIKTYQDGNLLKALQLWDVVAKTDKDYAVYAWHYMAYAELQLSLLPKTQNASERLNHAIQLCNAVLKDDDYVQIWPSAQWALMMAYLAKEGKDSAVFKSLLDKNAKVDVYKNQVKQLKKALDL